jgi:mono/diheme cytochrome c family protein
VGAAAPASKIDREAIGQRVATVTRAVANCRQAAALHRTQEAAQHAKLGLEAEPTRPELLAMQAKVQKDLAEAEDRWKDADRMRKVPRGEVHALTALERGLKLSVDHPGLVKLKAEMQGAIEGRTAPELTPAILAVLKPTTPVAELEEGRKLYTTRCTECHDLEMLDSRSAAGWQNVVSGMARRAGVDSAQQARILAYIAAASRVVQSEQ